MKKFFSAKWLLLVVLILYGSTYFLQNRYTSVSSFDPLTFSEPSQTAVSDGSQIIFQKKGYQYWLTPEAQYDISGLIVSRKDYRNFSIKDSDATFPMDLCMIWGNNVKKQVFKEAGLKFKQDSRFCLFSWTGPTAFNTNQVSNTHLLINDPLIEKQLKELHRGDQVRIKGKLVDVSAKAVGEVGNYDSPAFTMNTSLVRTDAGAGACEILYVEGLTVLRKGNELAANIHTGSFYALLLLAAYFLILTILVLIKVYTRKERVPDDKFNIKGRTVIHEDFRNESK